MDYASFRSLEHFLDFRRTSHPVVQRLRTTLRRFLAQVRGMGQPNPEPLIEAAREVVERVGEFRWLRPDDDGTSALMLDAVCPDLSQDTPSLDGHLLNVAVLAVYMGGELMDEQRRLEGLALAALVHDVGKSLWPTDIFSKVGPLSPDEREFLRQHPVQSAALVESWEGPLALLAAVILQEHERENGSGYPHGLKGGDISLEAKILGLADTYEAMTHNRPHKRAQHPHEVMKTLLSATTASLFDQRLLRLFTYRLSMYPLGSVVELSSRERGTVVGVNPDAPTRPYLLVVRENEESRLAVPRLVNLKEEVLLYVRRCLRLPKK